jgi:hypothetical protein
MEQIGTKIEKWRQSLNERMEENLLLKDRLANILKNDYDHSLLEEIEDFQTRLICEDELISSFRQVINELENLIKNDLDSDNELSGKARLKIAWLQKDIAYSNLRFSDLKTVFNCFQHKISSARG